MDLLRIEAKRAHRVKITGYNGALPEGMPSLVFYFALLAHSGTVNPQSAYTSTPS